MEWVWSRKKQDIRNSPSHCTWHWRGFLGGCIQVWAPCLSQCVAQLEGGQRQAPSEIRGLENVASEESLQLISQKKKVLWRQHHNSHQTHRSIVWIREAKLTVRAHSGCLTWESSLPAREDWTTCDLARTRLIGHCRKLHVEPLAPPFPTMFKPGPG